MNKRTKITGYRLAQKTIMFPKPIYVLEDNDDDMLISKVAFTITKEWTKADKQLKECKEFVDVILKHITNNGWSDDFTIDFWNMSEKELKVVNKMFRKKKEK